MQSETGSQQEPKEKARVETKGKLNAHQPIEQSGVKDPDPGPTIPPPGRC